MMAGYGSSPDAIKNNPVVAEGMNAAEKIVFSRALKNAVWNNSRIVNENIIEEMIQLKQLPGKDITILGSGSIITQFAQEG